MDKIKLLRPVPKEFPISSPFGWREIDGNKEFHKGIDYAVPVGTPIVACADGAIFRAGYEDYEDHSKGFGLRVWQEIEIKKIRYFIWYGHTSRILVKEGDHVKRGQEIALSGNTGRSTGPHLHVQVRPVLESECIDVDFEDA